MRPLFLYLKTVETSLEDCRIEVIDSTGLKQKYEIQGLL